MGLGLVVGGRLALVATVKESPSPWEVPRSRLPRSRSRIVAHLVTRSRRKTTAAEGSRWRAGRWVQSIWPTSLLTSPSPRLSPPTLHLPFFLFETLLAKRLEHILYFDINVK